MRIDVAWRFNAIFFCALFILGVSSQAALAMSCIAPSDKELDVKTRFGKAKFVFVGKLTGYQSKPRFDGWHESARAIFSVEESFKSSSPSQLVVRINYRQVLDKRYIVYAGEDKGELRADGPCSDQLFAIDDEENTKSHLRFLAERPAPGSGGGVSIDWEGRKFAGDGKPFAGITIELVGKSQTVRLVTDPSGRAKQDGLPEGTYRLTSLPPSGYRFACDVRPCGTFYVHDRGHTALDVRLEPVSSLKVTLADAKGKPVRLRAEFRVFDATTGREIGPLSGSYSYLYARNSRFAADEQIVPGEYVIGLVIAQVEEPGKSCTPDRRSRVIFDGGTEDIQQVRALTVKSGDNFYTFRLPDSLKPIRTQLAFSGAKDLDPSFVELELMGSDVCGNQSVRFAFERPRDNPDRLVFWSIPGQSWILSVIGHNIEGQRLRGMTISPKQDEVMKFKLTPQW